MFGIGMPELIIILGILLVIVGPSKLPQLGSSLGSAIRGFKKAADGEPVSFDNEQQKKPGHDL